MGADLLVSVVSYRWLGRAMMVVHIIITEYERQDHNVCWAGVP
jgi:hypothetical protein